MDTIILVVLLIILVFVLAAVLNMRKNFIEKQKTENVHGLYHKIDKKEDENLKLNKTVNKMHLEQKELKKKNDRLRQRLETTPNIGESITAKHLESIFSDFKDRKIIDHYRIINNIYINDIQYKRQIDHIVVCDYGFYLIETKHWMGDIFYHITKEDIEEGRNSFLTRYFFREKPNERKTFVIRENEEKGLESNMYGSPHDQVMNAIDTLRKEVFKKNLYINGFVYFNYSSDERYEFIDGTKGGNGVLAATNKDELKTSILKRFKKVDYKRFDKIKIDNYAEKLLEYDYA